MTHLFPINKLFRSLPLSFSLSSVSLLYTHTMHTMYCYLSLAISYNLLFLIQSTIVINNNHSGQRDKNNILVIIL